MKFNLKFYLLFALLITGFATYACSCIGPDKFFESVGPLTLHVEVIDVQALDTSKSSYTVTRLKVKKAIRGEYHLDTLLLLNDKGFECFHSLPNRDEGEEYIITGALLDVWNPLGSHIDSSYHNKIMVLGLCYENILKVEGDMVMGNITKNRGNKVRIIHKVNKVLMSDEDYGNWVAKRYDPPKRQKMLQCWSYSSFERRLLGRFGSG